MITVNALKIRNQFGEVLELLEQKKQPILIEKRKKVRAVLISYEDFLNRFIDKQAEEEKKQFLDQVRTHRKPSLVGDNPLDTLRRLRGYDD
jgi:prevent-host-death family protein